MRVSNVLKNFWIISRRVNEVYIGGFMKIGMLFSGYGGQYVGMGKDLYDNSRVMQELFEEASNCLGINFVKLSFASSDAELSSLENAYVAIFLIEVSLYALLNESGV